MVRLSLDVPIWDRFFMVSPLALVATKEGDGHDIAPKHMASPLGWQNFWSFVCSPRHGTYVNVLEHQAFTASFPGPDQIVETSMAAAPRMEDDSKPSLAALPTAPASVVDGVVVAGCYLQLECTLERIVDGFGENSLIVGKIVAASVDERFARGAEQDDLELIHNAPLLAYLAPGRFARVADSLSFPFPANFKL